MHIIFIGSFFSSPLGKIYRRVVSDGEGVSERYSLNLALETHTAQRSFPLEDFEGNFAFLVMSQWKCTATSFFFLIFLYGTCDRQINPSKIYHILGIQYICNNQCSHFLFFLEDSFLISLILNFNQFSAILRTQCYREASEMVSCLQFGRKYILTVNLSVWNATIPCSSSSQVNPIS